jgi:hypothetical protein
MGSAPSPGLLTSATLRHRPSARPTRRCAAADLKHAEQELELLLSAEDFDVAKVITAVAARARSARAARPLGIAELKHKAEMMTFVEKMVKDYTRVLLNKSYKVL